MRRYFPSCVIYSLLIIFLYILQFACAGGSRIPASLSTGNTSETSTIPLAPAGSASYDYQESIDINGEPREYRVHIPHTYDGTRAVPLLLVFHGYMGNPLSIANTSGFNDVSDSNGFIVVYPAGIHSTWHFNLSLTERKTDDTGFVSALIDKLVNELNIDKKMIYAAGFSDGAGMTHDLACRLSDKIAAAAMVAAPFSQAMEDSYKPLKPVPVMIIHGTQDPICKFGGGAVGLPGIEITTLPARNLVNYWIGYDGCSATPGTSELPQANDGTKVDIEQYSNSAGVGVIFYIVEGGGHTWPGGKSQIGGVGIISKTFNASQVIWQFVSQHPMK